VSTISSIDSGLEQFANALKSVAAYGKLQRALQMFQKSKNILFIRPDADGIVGIIKSQTKEDLDYSISINSKTYFCGTQNIHICGGLRGQICKHILLALIASVKSGVMDQKKALDLIKTVSGMPPLYDKSKARQIFQEYELSKNGELDWRPIEIFPEDLLAF
jgi:hypothetical protein